MFAIGQHETKWTHNAHGKSGEEGALQYLPTTWKLWSEEILGYVAQLTPINEKYVALQKVERWLAQGYDENDIVLMWNQGDAGPCRKGTNAKGVKYNSCAYAKSVLALLP